MEYISPSQYNMIAMHNLWRRQMLKEMPFRTDRIAPGRPSGRELTVFVKKLLTMLMIVLTPHTKDAK